MNLPVPTPGGPGTPLLTLAGGLADVWLCSPLRLSRAAPRTEPAPHLAVSRELGQIQPLSLPRVGGGAVLAGNEETRTHSVFPREEPWSRAGTEMPSCPCLFLSTIYKSAPCYGEERRKAPDYKPHRGPQPRNMLYFPEGPG